MPNKSVKKRNAREKETSQKPLAPNKLLLLVTVVPRRKAEFFLDLLQSFEVNLQMEVSAFGTASSFGLLNSDREKQALFSVIRQDMAQQALQELEKKFSTIRGGKGIAFTAPMTSTVGVAVYKFLSNKQ